MTKIKPANFAKSWRETYDDPNEDSQKSTLVIKDIEGRTYGKEAFIKSADGTLEPVIDGNTDEVLSNPSREERAEAIRSAIKSLEEVQFTPKSTNPVGQLIMPHKKQLLEKELEELGGAFSPVVEDRKFQHTQDKLGGRKLAGHSEDTAVYTEAFIKQLDKEYADYPDVKKPKEFKKNDSHFEPEITSSEAPGRRIKFNIPDAGKEQMNEPQSSAAAASEEKIDREPTIPAEQASENIRHYPSSFSSLQNQETRIYNPTLSMPPKNFFPIFIQEDKDSQTSAITSSSERKGKDEVTDSEHWYDDMDIFILSATESSKGDSKLCWRNPLSLDYIDKYLPDYLEAKPGDKILLPFNVGNAESGGEHWVGMVFEIKSDNQVDVQYFDSLGSNPQAKVPTSLQKIMTDSLRRSGKPIELNFIPPKIRVAQQNDLSSCGAYMMHNLRQAASGETVDILPTAEQLRAADSDIIKSYQQHLKEENHKRLEAEQRIAAAEKMPKEYKRDLHAKAAVQRIVEPIMVEKRKKQEARIEKEKKIVEAYLASLSEEDRKLKEERLQQSEKRAKAADLREEQQLREITTQNLLLPSRPKPKKGNLTR